MGMDKLENKKIGLLGGTFDPIHIGHLIIAEKVREEFNLEKVIFIPSGIPPHKKNAFTSSFHRYNMVKIAVSDNSFFDVSDIEIKKKSPSYTYITVKKMKKMYNNYNIFFIIGQDSLLDLPNWYNANKLIKEVDFIVAKRTIDFKYEKNENFPVNFKLSNSPIIGISSTYIRTCIKERKSIKYLLPEKVRMYIKKENIYG